MPASIHLICHREGASLKGLKVIDRHEHLWRSVSWELSEVIANEIVGGWVYFHPSKSQLSEFGGVVQRFEHTDTLSSHGKPEIAIIFQSRREARGQKWRGSSHGNAWCGGQVEMTLMNEKNSEP